MKRKAKCRLVKAQMTIAELEKSERAINANNETLEALDAKIALAKVELARMSKDADELRSKIGKDKQFHQRSRMQAQAELEESTKLYETALSVRDNWQKELDTAFQSDGD
ncbi:hypothetical protein GO639_03445 [Staphylococcus aureus]|nr:hypothetical protein [Staphylococcus aureus]